MKLTEEELKDTEKLRHYFVELSWREKEIIDGDVTGFDVSNRLVSIAWRYIEDVLPEMQLLLEKYNKHFQANCRAEQIKKMLSNVGES